MYPLVEKEPARRQLRKISESPGYPPSVRDSKLGGGGEGYGTLRYRFFAKTVAVGGPQLCGSTRARVAPARLVYRLTRRKAPNTRLTRGGNARWREVRPGRPCRASRSGYGPPKSMALPKTRPCCPAKPGPTQAGAGRVHNEGCGGIETSNAGKRLRRDRAPEREGFEPSAATGTNMRHRQGGADAAYRLTAGDPPATL
jgi:hypothetical protein